jgi:hypothetical protein
MDFKTADVAGLRLFYREAGDPSKPTIVLLHGFPSSSYEFHNLIPRLIFSKYIDAVGENCVNNMLPKWENRLGGAQQFMSTHCFTMAQSGRVDPTVQALLQNNTFVYK